MLHQTEDLQDFAIVATDGAIGDAKGFYFDDEAWAIRYFVVDAGSWLSSRMVMISPIDSDMPVTRQHETDHLDYYSYPYYRGGMGLWGSGGYPTMLMPGYAGYGSATATRAEADGAQARTEACQRGDDPHLRSCKAVAGDHIEANGGEIGHVHSLLADEESWAIRSLVVSTSHWRLGHDELVAPSDSAVPAASRPDRMGAATRDLRDTGPCQWRGSIGYRTQAALAPAA